MFWLGIILLVDVSFGLLFYDKWQSRFKSINLTRILWVEGFLAVILLIFYFVII